MSNPRLIPINSLIRRSDARQTSEEDLTALESSIAEVGLLNPITVRAMPDGMFEIIAGSHRYMVCDGLGHPEILCHVVEMDDLRAELAMIDENMCRAELSGILLDKQTARRKEIYEELHPETRLGENQHTRVRQVGEPYQAERFTSETAALTGRSERSVQRSAERGAKVSEEAAQLMRGTRLDTGTYADRIKDMPAAEQAEKVRRDLTEPPRPASAPAPKPAPAPAAANPNVYNRFIELADEVEALRIAELIASAGRQRSTLGQRASGLADMMSDIMEGLNR